MMDPTYRAFAEFAQSFGLVAFVLAFAGIVAYALWPANGRKFDRAARQPLNEE
jgi:cytochrome c oxidase cbb3-type subunit 4